MHRYKRLQLKQYDSSYDYCLCLDYANIDEWDDWPLFNFFIDIDSHIASTIIHGL